METSSLPLFATHQDLSATFVPFQGWNVVSSYGDIRSEYESLVTSAAVIDLSFLTVLKVSGRDRADYLNRRLSQLLLNLDDSDGKRATLLDASGHLQADLEIYGDGERCLILSVPRQGKKLQDELDKYVFTEDCVFSAYSDEASILGILGPRAEETAERAGIQLPRTELRLARQAASGSGELICLRSELVPGGYLLVAPSSHAEHLWGSLCSACGELGGGPAGTEAFHLTRIEKGCPWFGIDMKEDSTPLDAHLWHAIDRDKGCFPGQEAIARIANLGHPSRQLVGVAFSGAAEIRSGVDLMSPDGKKAGTVTSCGFSYRLDKCIGLAMVRWTYREEGTVLLAGDREGRVTRLPFIEGGTDGDA